MQQQILVLMYCSRRYMLHTHLWYFSPSIVKLLLAVEGLLLDTLHWYCPGSLPVTVSVWVYCAVSVLSSTVIPPVTSSEYLVQVTVVAGPPVEIQVRVNWGLFPLRSDFTVKCMLFDMITSALEWNEFLSNRSPFNNYSWNYVPVFMAFLLLAILRNIYCKLSTQSV